MIPVIYSILLAAEVLIIAAAISNAIPYPHNPLYDQLFQRFVDQSVAPTRQLLLYTIFLASCLIIQASMVCVWRGRLMQKDLLAKISRLSMAQTFWVFVEIFAAFKIYIYHGPAWAKALFYGALAASVLSKIFWPEFNKVLTLGYAKVLDLRSSMAAARAGDALVVLFIGSILWVTDWDKCLSSIADLDNFAGPQQFFGITLWGRVLGLANASPGFQVGFMIIVSLFYFVAVYWLLCLWLKERLLALFGVLLAVKLQYFNEAMMPLPWAYPSSTVLMHAWDALFFIALWFYSKQQSLVAVAAMTGFCALAIAFMPFAGFCLWLAYAAAMGMDLFSRRKTQMDIYSHARGLGLAVLAVPLLGWGLIKLMHGAWVWPNAGALIVQQLNDRHYFSFFFGFLVLGLYAAAVLEKRSVWTVVLGVYGLASFGQYARMPFVCGYETYVVALVLLIVDRIKQLLPPANFYLRLALALLGVAMLLTNSVFLLYPDLWRHLF